MQTTIDTYRNKYPHYRDLLDVLEAVITARTEHRASFTTDIVTVPDRLAREKFAAGFPLVDFTTDVLSSDDARRYFVVLLRTIAAGRFSEAETLAKDITAGTVSYDEMVRTHFKSGIPDVTVGEESFDLVSYLLEESLRPAMEHLEERFHDTRLDGEWSKGYCPLCGKVPRIGELRTDEGRRFLYCAQCGIDWSYRRLTCPFCENSDQKTLAYFTAGDDESRRVDVCNECQRYIKTVDFRDSGRKADLEVERIVTIHLDLLARRENYR